MKDKKLYCIIHASCIVSRHSGIKELDTFSFLLSPNMYTLHQMKKELKSSIDFYNEFCPEDFVISNFENAEFEKVGEIWL